VAVSNVWATQDTEPSELRGTILVVSVDDPRVGDYRRLNDPQFRARHEAATGRFIVESPGPLRTVLASPRRGSIRSVLITPEQHATLDAELRGLDAPIFIAPRSLLAEIIGFDLHRGVLAAADRPAPPALDDVLVGARVIAVCERLNDHENLGGLFRSAAALGVDGLLIDPECADPWYRRCVRVSIGHVTTVPWTRAERWPASLDDVRAAGFTVAALTPSRDAVELDVFAAGRPERVAILVGAEGPGLTPTALAASDVHVRIPMRDGVDSLNVATAAAIAFQRLTRLS
jgi:tRNA G18 (ribose-2'-O)-methylase SpoU